MTERFHIDDPIFQFVDVGECMVRENGKINCECVKNGLRYVYAHFEADTKLLFYIGLGKFDRCNRASHRNKYWTNVYNKHGIIIKFIAVDLSKDEAKEIERLWILRTNPICNMTIGGEAGENENLRRVVYCYKKNGEFHMKFDSMRDANIYFKSKLFGNIGKCLNGERELAFGYQWRDKYYEKIEQHKTKVHTNAKIVHRYDLDGNYIETLQTRSIFPYRADDIARCIDENFTHFGSFWRSYKIDKIECVVPKPALRESKKVIDTSTGIIYQSISSAAKLTGVNSGNLSQKLNGTKPNNTTLKYYITN